MRTNLTTTIEEIDDEKLFLENSQQLSDVQQSQPMTSTLRRVEFSTEQPATIIHRNLNSRGQLDSAITEEQLLREISVRIPEAVFNDIRQNAVVRGQQLDNFSQNY